MLNHLLFYNKTCKDLLAYSLPTTVEIIPWLKATVNYNSAIAARKIDLESAFKVGNKFLQRQPGRSPLFPEQVSFN